MTKLTTCNSRREATSIDTTMTQPVVISSDEIAQQPSEHFPDVRHGSGLNWKTLLSSSKTPTDTLTTGIATCAPGNSLLCTHQHTHAEIYYVIRGSGVVEIEGKEFDVKEGSVVFIPSDAKHGVRNASGSEEFVWLYVFAADGFGEVEYRFLTDGS
ncbi:uncharacterized protein LTR77_002495 [Saxophila tyrrhenica]|uniref:Cupin type-2 domain-containing protein n=1 Tax=Saxophila tyrrhenica TaxID=1690608 RepID=A0AAV9PJN4_9PEZI|nr:hypothetical protein LTR77_002495 [Saxophila tyrrhenica]